MLLLGHVGITIATAKILESSINKKSKYKNIALDYIIVASLIIPEILDTPLVVTLAQKPVGSAGYIFHSLGFIL